MKQYKCSYETHMKCENSAICHLCDGVSLYKNTGEERQAKREEAEARKEAEKNAPLRTHKREKKEGMGFEKDVAKKWNNYMNRSTQTSASPMIKTSQKKTKVQKPRISLDDIMEKDSNEEQQQIVEERFTPPITGLGKIKPITSKPRQEAKRQVNSGAMWHSKGDIKLDHALMECKERGTVNARGQKSISIPKDWIEKQVKESLQEQRPYWYIPFRYKGDEEIYLVKSYDHEMELIYELREAQSRIKELEKELITKS